MPGVCPRCLREVYFAEEKLALGKVWHTFCFSCRNCRKLLDSCTVSTHCGELFCRNCCTRLFAPSVRSAPPPPAINLSVDHRGPPYSSSRVPVSACDSVSDCYCCCCCPDQEDFSVADQVRSDPRGNRLDKQRLRGGGGEEEGSEEFRICPDTRHCSDSECSNLGVVSSGTTLCNAASSPTAVTTWYNRQHSTSQSSFGGQACSRRHSDRPNEPASNHVNEGKDFRGSFANRVNEGQKGSVLRRSGQNHREQKAVKSSPQSQQQQEPDKQQESRHDQIQQQIKSGGFIRNNNNNNHLQPHSGYLPTREKSATASSSKNNYHHQCPRRRVSFCSDVPAPEEGNSNSSSSEISSFRMNMPNDHDNGNNYNGNTTSQYRPPTPNNYTSSNGTTNYETCYEMDDPNPPNENQVYNCSPNSPEDGSPRPSVDREDDSRLRGGCGNRGAGCSCGGCPPPTPCPPCGIPSPCDPPCCPPAGCRPVCRKPGRSCCPPCVAEPPGCGSGGCCGGGCRGGCGKPGRLCAPLRPCSAPPCQPQVCRPRGSPCVPPRCCAPMPPCCKPPGVTFRPGYGYGGGGGGSCCRSKSPRRGCCSSAPQDDGCGYCGPKLPPGCECLGGGLDCQRCGRKVYQAEMQIASGVPYHNICFSCFCCRKPLEPLTYQENCGEIYCKHCYVRNFGPQGYGYGAGAGVLQTPM